MREVEQMHGGIGAEGGATPGAGSLVVLSEKLGPIARATLWLRGETEGQRLVVVPHLHIEHVPAMIIAGGTGLGVVFGNIKLMAPEWEEPAAFVGGAWKMWKLGRPELHGAGFVLGGPKFDIEKAVRGCAKFLS